MLHELPYPLNQFLPVRKAPAPVSAFHQSSSFQDYLSSNSVALLLLPSPLYFLCAVPQGKVF